MIHNRTICVEAFRLLCWGMMIAVTWEGNPTVIMLMSTAKSLAKLRGEILAGKLQLQQNCIWITFIDFQPKQIIPKRENEKSKEEFHVSWSVFGGRISLLLMSDVSPLLPTPSPLVLLVLLVLLLLTRSHKLLIQASSQYHHCHQWQQPGQQRT